MKLLRYRGTTAFDIMACCWLLLGSHLLAMSL